MADETATVETEVEEAVAEEVTGKFDQLFSGEAYIAPNDTPDDEPGEADEQDVEDAGDETGDETGEDKQEVEKPATPEADGPSLAMQAIARQHQIPEQLIGLSRDDQQLQELIQLAAENSGEDQTEEPVEVADFELDLPKEEFGDDDPIRRELTRLNSHHSGQVKQLTDFVKEMGQIVQGLHEQAETSTRESAADFQRQFDQGLSELESEILGTDELNDNHVEVRKAVWAKAQSLKSSGATGTASELAQQAAQELFPAFLNNQQASRQEATKRQVKKRLGGGPSKPAEPQPTRKDDLFAKWAKIMAASHR